MRWMLVAIGLFWAGTAQAECNDFTYKQYMRLKVSIQKASNYLDDTDIENVLNKLILTIVGRNCRVASMKSDDNGTTVVAFKSGLQGTMFLIYDGKALVGASHIGLAGAPSYTDAPWAK